MAGTGKTGSSRNSMVINASCETVYRAFTDPAALSRWQAPGDMVGEVHEFDGRVGGGYEMSLYYPESEQEQRGKSGAREDRYTARFLELVPPARIVQAIAFASDDPAFAGDMIMTVMLQDRDGGTEVTIVFDDIPPGISPSDNEVGTQLSLEKLARYIERGSSADDPGSK